MRYSQLLPAAALAVGASAATNYLGFNSGSTLQDRSAKFKKDWVQEFTTARNLVGAPGTFNAVRLYTNIQAYSQTSEPIEAFEAAIETQTYILLGVWASGTTSIDGEITALKNAVSKFGSNFTDLVIGISIGSEDLYRNSVTGVANKAGVGSQPDTIVKFINDYKTAFANTPLASVPVGHVDTWDVWPNATNKAVLDAVDWVGVDEYPYYENGKGNDIKNSGTLFDKAFNAVQAAVGNKPIWLTETGWPTSGPAWDQGVPSIQNAQYYWAEVGCRKLFNKVPTFWYNLRDSNPDNTMKFAITDSLSTSPYFNLTCPTVFDTPTGTASTATSGATAGPSGASVSTASSGATPTGGAGSNTTTSSPTPTNTKNAAPLTGPASGASFAGLAVAAGLFALF